MDTTVLIPAYNRARYLPDAVRSALASTVPCRVLICDDASTDDTLAVADRLAREHPGVSVIRQHQNRGESAARNALLDEVETEFACWLDSDDVMHPKRIERQIMRLEEDRADICWTSYQTFANMPEFNHPAPIRKYAAPNLAKWWELGWPGLTNNVTNPTGLFRVNAVRHHRFPVGVRWGGQDVLWTYSIFRHHHPITTLDQCLYSLRHHNQRISVLKSKHTEDKQVEARILTDLREQIEAKSRMYSDKFWSLRLKEQSLLRRMGKSIVERLGGIQTAIDLGCGTGSLMEGFQQAGVTRVVGYDLGMLESKPYTDKAILPRIHGHNLAQPLRLLNTHDLATSLEVAEHLRPEDADQFVKNLTGPAKRWIVMTAAPPGQGGSDHLNEQPQSYWIEKMTRHGWKLHEAHTQWLSDHWKSFLPKPKFYYWQNVMVFTA